MANSSEELRAECQRFLTSFRVLELKELLKIHGQSTKGRKPELFQRANEILQFGSPKFQTQIREIYERSNISRKQLNSNRAAQKSSPVKHTESVIKNQSRSYIVHPDVRFKVHPFFSKIDTITRPTALVSPGMSTHGNLNMKLKFHLTPQQIHQIYISKTSTGTYQTQVLVRFCLQETTCDQNDYYPKQCYVKVNGHNSTMPGYHPHLSTRPDYKRNGQPINITNFVKTSPAEINEVVIYWAHDIMVPQGYCVGVEVAVVVSSSDLLQALKAKGVRSPDMSRALVKEKFAVDKDSEVAATSMKVSLLCPIGKMRMSYPCRTINCSHLQCFDASIFYQMNEKRARWVCPVCDKPALPGDLFIDGLFMEICQKSPSSADNIIEFLADGSWKPSLETSGGYLNVDTPDRRGNSPISVDTPEGGSKKKSDVVVIDLTISSDEEDNGRDGEEEERGEEKEDGEIDDEEEVGVEEERWTRINNHTREPYRTHRRLQSDDATPSDSESTVSSHSSTTITAPISPPSPPPHSQTNTFPHLSIPLSTTHSSSSSSSSIVVTPTRSRSSSTADSRSRHTHSKRLQSSTTENIPPTSMSIGRISSESHSAIPSSSSVVSGSASSSLSRPTSVIMQNRPQSSHAQLSPHHRHLSSFIPISHSQSRSHSQAHSRSHSRIRKHSHSGSQSSPRPHSSSHSIHTHPYLSSSHPHSQHHRHKHHHHHHQHTHSHLPSHENTSSQVTSSSSTSGGEGGRVGSDARGNGVSVSSQDMGLFAPYFSLQHNEYTTPGDALLTSNNMYTLDENIVNLFRAGIIPLALSHECNTDSDD